MLKSGAAGAIGFSYTRKMFTSIDLHRSLQRHGSQDYMATSPPERKNAAEASTQS